MANSVKNFVSTHSKLFVVGAVALVIVGVAGTAVYANTHKPQPVPKPIVINPSHTNPNATVTATPDPNVGGGPGNGSGTTVNSPVYPPYGSLVSNFSPKLTSSEQSTCNTNPGATCYISFTKDGVTKSLAIKDVASSPKEAQAFATWSWTPQEIGLTPGTWQITATAGMNGQQRTTTSSKSLEVSS